MEESKQSSRVFTFLGKALLTVSGPQVREEYAGAKQYYVYTIQGSDNKGPIDIKRRYSDFTTFRTLLVKRWPGVYIPSLPTKIKVNYSDDQFVKLRIAYLEKFLNYLAERQFIWYQEEAQFFVKNSTLNLTKAFDAFAKIQVDEIIRRYESTFEDIIKGDVSDNTKAVNIATFDFALKQLFPKVNELRNRAEQAFNAQQKFHTKYSKMLIPVMARYEEKCLSEYAQLPQGKTIGVLTKSEGVQTRQELKQNLHQTATITLFEEVKRQKRQIQAFQEALAQRGEYLKQSDKLNSKIKSHESKIEEEMDGKKTFMEKIRKMSREEIIKGSEESITKYNQQLLKVQKLCEYIDAVMVEEIKIFQAERQRSYYEMAYKIIKIEQVNIEKQRAFWKLFEDYQHHEHYFEIQQPRDNSKVYYSPVKQQQKGKEAKEEENNKKEQKSEEKQEKAEEKDEKGQEKQQKQDQTEEKQGTLSPEQKKEEVQDYQLQEQNENTLSFEKKKNKEEEIRVSSNSQTAKEGQMAEKYIKKNQSCSEQEQQEVKQTVDIDPQALVEEVDEEAEVQSAKAEEQIEKDETQKESDKAVEKSLEDKSDVLLNKASKEGVLKEQKSPE